MKTTFETFQQCLFLATKLRLKGQP